MKKLLVVLFAFFGVATLAGCGTIEIDDADAAAFEDAVNEALEDVSEAVEAEDGFSLYANADYNFSIQYPTDWEMQEDSFGSHVMFFTPQVEGDMFRENVGVITEQLPSDMTVDEYYEEAKVHLVDFISDFDEVLNENVKVGGIDAKKVQYLGSQGDYMLKWQQVFFIKDKVTYVVTYTSLSDTFDTFVETVDKMVETMSVK